MRGKTKGYYKTIWDICFIWWKSIPKEVCLKRWSRLGISITMCLFFKVQDNSISGGISNHHRGLIHFLRFWSLKKWSMVLKNMDEIMIWKLIENKSDKCWMFWRILDFFGNFYFVGLAKIKKLRSIKVNCSKKNYL